MTCHQLTKGIPFKNQAIKLKLTITNNQKDNIKEVENNSSSRNGFSNKATSPRLNDPSSQEQTLEDKYTKRSHQISLEEINKNNLNDSPQKKVLTTHYSRKKPERFFAVIKNQYNIESKVNNSRRYQSITSFETKWNKELERLSHYYNKTDSRQLFYDNQTLRSLWNIFPQFDKYIEMKRIENRYAGVKFKSKFLPLKFKSKDNLIRFAKGFYYNKFILNEKIKAEKLLKRSNR